MSFTLEGGLAGLGKSWSVLRWVFRCPVTGVLDADLHELLAIQ